MDIKSTESAIVTTANESWGFVRRFIAAHPLTGAWSFAGVAFVLGWLAHGIV